MVIGPDAAKGLATAFEKTGQDPRGAGKILLVCGKALHNCGELSLGDLVG